MEKKQFPASKFLGMLKRCFSPRGNSRSGKPCVEKSVPSKLASRDRAKEDHRGERAGVGGPVHKSSLIRVDRFASGYPWQASSRLPEAWQRTLALRQPNYTSEPIPRRAIGPSVPKALKLSTLGSRFIGTLLPRGAFVPQHIFSFKLGHITQHSIFTWPTPQRLQSLS